MLKRPVPFRVGRLYDIETFYGGVTQTRYSLKVVVAVNNVVTFESRTGERLTLDTMSKTLVGARENMLSEPAKIMAGAGGNNAVTDDASTLRIHSVAATQDSSVAAQAIAPNAA
ncbi:MAG: hypothetical protein WAW96_16615 [Alphaproteobacteria bacterium]